MADNYDDIIARLDERIVAIRERMAKLEERLDQAQATRRSMIVLIAGAILTAIGALIVSLLTHALF